MGNRPAYSTKPFLVRSNSSGAAKSLISARRSFFTVRGLRSTKRASMALVG